MNSDRPKKINDIILSMRYWDYKNTLIFFKEFIALNCGKVNFTLNKDTKENLINNLSENEMKSRILTVLQTVNHYNQNEIKLPKAYN